MSTGRGQEGKEHRTSIRRLCKVVFICNKGGTRGARIAPGRRMKNLSPSARLSSYMHSVDSLNTSTDCLKKHIPICLPIGYT